jgi:hypothetical protein
MLTARPLIGIELADLDLYHQDSDLKFRHYNPLDLLARPGMVSLISITTAN